MSWTMIALLVLALAGTAGLAYAGYRGWQAWQSYLKRPLNYFLRNLSAAQKQSLVSADIAFTDTTSDNSPGVIIMYKDHKKALQALSAVINASLPLNGKELHEGVLAYPHANAGDPEQSRIIMAVERRKDVSKRFHAAFHNVLSGHITTPIRVIPFPESGYDGEGNGSTFMVSFGKGPKTVKAKALPARIFDIPLPNGQEASAYCRKGSPIIDDATGYVVGELVKNHLYLYFDLRSLDEEVSLALITRALQRVLIERDPAKFLPEVLVSEGADPANVGAPRIYEENFADAKERAIVRAITHSFLSPSIVKEIHVKDCQGKVQPPLNDGLFHIFFNSTPMLTTSEKVPQKFFGIDLLSTDNAFGFSGHGVPLFDENGFVYAELVGDNLYLHQYFLTTASKQEAIMLARVFKQIGLRIEKRELSQNGPRFSEEDLRIDAAVVLGSLPAVGEKKSAKLAEEALTGGMKIAVKSDDEMFRLERSAPEELGREFDELCRIHNVRSVEVKNNSIVLMTDKLYCVDPRSNIRHEIGAFKIVIPFSHESQVQWLNQTRTIKIDNRTMHAPHVSSNGHACLGNMADVFPMLIKKREFASAAMVAIAFIEAVNVADTWGKHIPRWPHAAS